MLRISQLLSVCGVAAAMFVGPLASAEQVNLQVAPAYDLLKSSDKQTTWIRVGLVGFELKSDKQRAPINVAIVLDKSGSMKGEKIAKAKSAAIDAISRLNSNDIVSVITYDTTVSVLVPATKLTDKELVKSAIARVSASGGTALFAGVSKGAAELRKFINQERINRVILLSDGLANEGPSSPSELGALGASLKKEGISVSTLGLGLDYNEDLMAKLAARSGGNHHFVEEATELADVFNREFDDVTSVVAQNVNVTVTIPEGIRPVRVMGNESEITGQTIQISMSQIYSKQDKYAVIELEVPAGETGQKLQLAKVVASYLNMQSNETDKLTGTAAIKFTDNAEEVEGSLNQLVMEQVVEFIANERNKLATAYLDAGDLLNCTKALEANNEFLKENADKFNSVRLQQLYFTNDVQFDAVLNKDFNRARKDMRYLQNTIDANGPQIQSQLAEPTQQLEVPQASQQPAQP